MKISWHKHHKEGRERNHKVWQEKKKEEANLYKRHQRPISQNQNQN